MVPAAAKKPYRVFRIAAWSSAIGYGYYTFRNFQDALDKESVYAVSPYKLALYRVLPLSSMTWLAGHFAALPIPIWLRGPLYGAFSWLYDCNLGESAPLESFSTFNHFFTRSLNPGLRPISRDALVSPADGKILALGTLDSSTELYPEQIKGVKYPLDRFLGRRLERRTADRELYYCSVYLAPGSYHRFHSPTDSFAVDHVHHIKGEVLPVAPWLMRLIPGLVSLNERAILSGRWKHGCMFMAPVGATNVRSISFAIPTEHRSVLTKGQEVGQFEMGSLVVLVFEAPSNLQWKVGVNEWIKFGEPLADLQGRSFRWPFGTSASLPL